MIKRLRIRNVKSVHDTDIEFANLTLVAGANSSGKSSLLQSILLWQSAVAALKSNHPEFVSTRTHGRNQAISLIKTRGSRENPNIEVQIETRGHLNFKSSIEIADIASASLWKKENEKLAIVYAQLLKIEFESQKQLLKFKMQAESQNLPRDNFNVRWYEKIFRDSEIGNELTENSLVSLYELGEQSNLNNLLAQIYSQLETDGPEKAQNFLTRRHEFGQIIEIPRNVNLDMAFLKTVNAAPYRWSKSYLETIERQRLLTDQIFEVKIFYLGPFRSIEQLSLSGDASYGTIVGDDGRFTFSIMEKDGQKIVESPDPRTGVIRNRRLLDAIRDWGEELGLFEAIEGSGSNLRLYDDGAQMGLPLSSLGSAVSQCLPVLVTCLLAEPGSTILIEQPEVHLHPRLQQLMGDFLIGISRSGKQLIVETHSDHLIERVRRRIVEDDTDELSKTVRCAFFRRPDGKSSVNCFSFDRFGSVPEWPEGFFDESHNEASTILEGMVRKFEKNLVD
jgi:predicted ATPase